MTRLREACEGRTPPELELGGGGIPGGNSQAWNSHRRDLQASAESAGDPITAISRFADGLCFVTSVGRKLITGYCEISEPCANEDTRVSNRSMQLPRNESSIAC